MSRRVPATAEGEAEPEPATIPEKHELPKKPRPPKQVKDAAENKHRAIAHAALLKDWERQMEEHAERMAARKKAQKAASRPTDDSERRVRQRQQSEAQVSAHRDREAPRSMSKQQSERLNEQQAAVRQCRAELLESMLVCVARSRQGCDAEMCTPGRCAFMGSRGEVLLRLHQLQYAAEHPPDGTPNWWQLFEGASDSHNVWRRPWSEQELEWLQDQYTSEAEWDAALAGTERRKDGWYGWENVTGKNIMRFLHSQLVAQRLALPRWRGIWGYTGESWVIVSNAALLARHDAEHPDEHWSSKWRRGSRIRTASEASLRCDFIDAHRVHFEVCQYTSDGNALW